MATWCIKGKAEGRGGGGAGGSGVQGERVCQRGGRPDRLPTAAAEHLMLALRSAWFSAPPRLSISAGPVFSVHPGIPLLHVWRSQQRRLRRQVSSSSQAARFFHLPPAEFGGRGRVRGNLIYAPTHPPSTRPSPTRQEQLHFMTDRPCHP